MIFTKNRLGWLGACLALQLIACSDSDDAVAPRELASSERIFDWVEDITGFGVRTPDSPGLIGAAEYVRNRFEQSGLIDVAIESADTVAWSATRWGLSVSGRELPCFYMQHTFHDGTPAPFSTGPAGRTAEIVYVGDGRAEDFEGIDVAGKIVVSDVRFSRIARRVVEAVMLGVQDSAGTFGPDYELMDPYSRNTFPRNYYNAAERGAAGFVGILTDYFESNEYHNEAYDSYRPGGAMRIPGLWLSPSQGAALAQSLRAASAPVTATLRLEGKLERATGRNVIGYLRGTSDELIMIQSHHDSVSMGATEDASGTALVLALAQYFGASPRAQRQRGLLFTTMDTHFTDYGSHRAFVTRHIEKERIVANVTLEHIANEWAMTDQGFAPTGLLAPRGFFVSSEIEGFNEIGLRAIQDHALERTVALPTAPFSGAGIPTDASPFFNAGVPVLSLVGAPLYLYDTVDTLDKVPVAELGRVAKAFVEVVERLDALPAENFKQLPKKPGW